MSEVDRVLSDYIAEHRAGGEADPVAYLERLEGAEREELAALIDAYLQRTPARAWDPDSFDASPAKRLAESLHRSLAGHAGYWPVVLPRMRERAEIKRAELVERLAESLGVADRQEKVGTYYHEMEQGSLESSGVSDRVLEALAGIVGGSVRALREAGERMTGGVSGEGPASPAFTRIQHGNREAEAATPGAAREPVESQTAWDEVDDLFRSGSAKSG